ncbi:hypothetical protein OAA09_00855 [bacterium]|nr:hypothetical protein [bacterium]
MSLIIRKKSGIILRKAGKGPLTFKTRDIEIDHWLNELVVKAVTEQALSLPPGSLSFTTHEIYFYPVWTKGPSSKSKTVKKIAVKLSCDEIYHFSESVDLKEYGLLSYDELLDCFDSSDAVRQNGVKDFFKRYRTT